MSAHYIWNKRWRERHPTKRYAQKSRYRAHSRRYAHRASTVWTIREIMRVLNHRIPDSKLSMVLKRSVEAIQDMRQKILSGERLIRYYFNHKKQLVPRPKA